MQSEIIVAILSGCGTLIGTIGGIMATNKLTTYRIQELEKKVDKHNNLIDRMYAAEKEIAIIKDELNDRKEEKHEQ